ncbi:MAG: hypothetical protein GX963_13305 [Bacteroidales bacterium]|nr:hypothetical protein [Bacteroidales bacterium]
MRVNQITNKTEVIEYDSLQEFYQYLVSTPFNEAFCWEKHSSVEGSYYFTKTKDFNEAVELFRNGWSDMATKLVQKLKVIESKIEPTMKPRNVLGVAGYQVIVPLYLQGIPNNMVTKKMVPVKQKVITLNKSIDYNAGVSADRIIEESVKAMQIVKKLEAQGYRCNLNIVLGTTAGYPSKQFVVKVRIKSANEKLNVSKLAFPLVHPSMLRRLFFRFIEVYPHVTKSFVSGYGTPATSDEMRNIFKGEYLLPNFIKKDVNTIKTIDDLENV